MALLPFAFAGAQAGLSIFGALGQNSATKAQQRAAYKNIDEQIQQSRMQFADSTQIAHQQASMAQGAYRNAIGWSSSSAQDVWAAQQADIETDQAIRARDQENRVKAFQAQKQNIYAQGNAQMSSPIIEGIKGGLSGYMTGLGIEGSLANIKAAEAAGEMSKAQSALAQQQFGLQQQGFAAQQNLWGMQQGVMNTQTRLLQDSYNFSNRSLIRTMFGNY